MQVKWTKDPGVIAAVFAIVVMFVVCGWWLASRADAKTHWHRSVASYYDDSGATASGRHHKYGVANRWLPFGTKLRMCDRGCVTVVVDDRGPYVGGRDFDLNLAAVRAIGFSTAAGVEPVIWHRL